MPTTSTKAMKDDIERTRQDLGETLEALGDKVSPKKVVGRAKESVHEKMDDAKHRFAPRTLLRRATSGARDGHVALPVATERSSRPSSSRPRIDVANPIERNVQNENGDHAMALRERAESNPLVAGLLAFGGGLALAAALKPSDTERKAAVQVKQRIEPVKRQAVEAGRSVVHELQPAAQSRLDHVKERATQGAERVKAKAQSSAENLKAEAETATADVTVEAKQAARTVKRRSTESAKTVKATTKSEAARATGRARTARPRTTGSAAAPRARRRADTAAG